MALAVLVKPASGACNLHCRYCFYREETALRENGSCGLMTRETALNLLERAKERTGPYLFAFQGGEPMLAGSDFFRWFTEKARSILPKDSVSFSLQTNGTLIDEDWAAFFAREGWLIGLSLDGPKDIHNKNRSESFDAALGGLRLLQNAGVQVNVLTVVTAQMAKRPEAVYAFLKKQNLLWQQFIPCMSPLEGPNRDPWELTPAMYGSFLSRLFDLWYADITAGIPVSNRVFENWVRMLAGLPAEECGMAGQCAAQYVAEADGMVYPCDFYCLDEWALGNVNTHSFDEMDARRDELGFLRRKPEISPQCLSCRYFSLCRGGCPRCRDGNGLNLLCGGYRIFFDYAGARLFALTRRITR